MIFLNSSANESSAKFIHIYLKVKQGRGHTEELRGIKRDGGLRQKNNNK